jgi:hypothetical protein
VGGGVQLGPLGTAATNRPIVSAPGEYDDGEIGGMIGTGNRSTQRKPGPVPLCPPQTPHAAQMRTRAAAVGSQRLTAWATARPIRDTFTFTFCCRHWREESTTYYLCDFHKNIPEIMQEWPLFLWLAVTHHAEGELAERDIVWECTILVSWDSLIHMTYYVNRMN